MSISTFPSWPHAMSYYYKISHRHAKSLLELDLLPPVEAAGSLANCYTPGTIPALHNSIDPFDDLAIDTLEERRALFDTEPCYFIRDLRDLGAALAAGNFEEEPHKKALVEFRDFTFGRRPEKLYPVAPFWMPWCRHRVAVTLDEIRAADYASLFRIWNHRDADPFSNFAADGGVELGHPYWMKHGDRPILAEDYPSFRRERGEFLLRLADVLEARK